MKIRTIVKDKRAPGSRDRSVIEVRAAALIEEPAACGVRAGLHRFCDGSRPYDRCGDAEDFSKKRGLLRADVYLDGC